MLGKLHSRPARLDKKLTRELKALATAEDPYDTLIGKTMCTYDFYEGAYSRASASLIPIQKMAQRHLSTRQSQPSLFLCLSSEI